MSEITIILNDAGYGDERPYNALRYAKALVEKDATVNLFLMADSVTCALEGQETPKGYYNLARMFKYLVNKDMEIHACGSCMETRGITEKDFVKGVKKSTMGQLADWTLESDDVIVF
ncbi:MAG: DsrE/DsrF/TusD sulfur relay family protein [Candidatus Natronoplasma sp.]